MTSTTLKEENVLENDDDFFDDETKKKNATKTPPSLRTRMRHLAKLVHPDALGPNVPKECKDNNQSALAELNGVLDSITKEKKFPKTGVKRLKFYYVGRSEEKKEWCCKEAADEEKSEEKVEGRQRRRVGLARGEVYAENERRGLQKRVETKFAEFIRGNFGNERESRGRSRGDGVVVLSGRLHVGGVGLGERRDQGGARAGTVLRGEEETNGGIREDGRTEKRRR